MDDVWAYSEDYGQICQIIEAQTLWGETVFRVWLPDRDSVVRIPASRLKSIAIAGISSSDHIVYVGSAARVVDAIDRDVLLAPFESSVIPLPHQIQALSRAISTDQVRYLLADEVGLGKTIEAGLIMRELKLRGLVKRTLVVAPKGLVSQWVSEMRFHFGETFQLVLPDDIKTLKRIVPIMNSGNGKKSSQTSRIPGNTWQMFDQVVVPMDSVKPLDNRRGWTPAQIDEYNRERFEDLISAGWDLVIVDEAHRLGGSSDQVARFKLGQGLSEAAPYLLLLSATPHQGKTDSFHRLLSLIDAQEFSNNSSVTRERVQLHVIRTEKRRAIDADGKPLFKHRCTQLAPVSWKKHHQNQQLLYEAITEYVREGYNQAIQEKKSYIGFLMILMQRLVVSSTRAIRTTLERRLEALATPEKQVPLLPLTSDEEWGDLDGQGQIDMLLHIRLKALKNEHAKVKQLLDAAVRCEQDGPDAKAEALLDWLYRLQSEECDPELKTLVFTEFVPTQHMLRRFLVERGFSVVCLNGSMDMEERKQVQEEFSKDIRILISTDAGGEGLNLQFCHVVINYDIPWNPMRLEQRIGRVDRIGQPHAVRALNFVFEDTVEHRVREVLEQKLAVIFEEFGIDKTGDVLDSAQAGQMFDEMYVEAILNPEKVEDSVGRVVAHLEEQAREERKASSLFGTAKDLNPSEAQRVLTHPLPYWVERMTVSYLKAHGGQVERRNQLWNLTWPDGETDQNVFFTGNEAGRIPSSRHLTIEETKVRALIMRLPRFAPSQLIPIVSIPGFSEKIQGIWSLWQISIITMELNRRKIMPLFLADNGMVFLQTARYVWDQLLTESPQVLSMLDENISRIFFTKLQNIAKEHGELHYEELVTEHRTYIAREREKAIHAFNSRRKTFERIGLSQVRNFRLNHLEQEERSFQEKLDQKAIAYPEMVPLLVMRVDVKSHE